MIAIHDMVIDHDLHKLFIFKKDKQKNVSDYQWSISIMVIVDGNIADKDCDLRSGAINDWKQDVKNTSWMA